jgi:hypothetical protein
MLFLGIDQGKKGGYCFLNENAEIVEIGPLPMNTATDSLDSGKLCEILVQYIDEDIHASAEDLQAIFGVSSSSTFSFGYEIGKVKTILEILEIPLSEIKPLMWQTHMFALAGIEQIYQKEKTKTGKLKRDTKAMAFEACKVLYPNLDPKHMLKTKDGVRDALLIARYGFETSIKLQELAECSLQI